MREMVMDENSTLPPGFAARFSAAVWTRRWKPSFKIISSTLPPISSAPDIPVEAAAARPY